MSTITEFLYAAPACRSIPGIIAWWERRRLAYNAWVGAAGLVSLGAGALVSLVDGGDAPFPEILIGAAVFGGMANLCYCLGPVVEILFEKLWGRGVLPVGPMLYRMGLIYSVGLALFPALLMVMLMTARTVLGALGLHWN